MRINFRESNRLRRIESVILGKSVVFKLIRNAFRMFFDTAVEFCGMAETSRPTTILRDQIVQLAHGGGLPSLP